MTSLVKDLSDGVKLIQLMVCQRSFLASLLSQILQLFASFIGDYGYAVLRTLVYIPTNSLYIQAMCHSGGIIRTPVCAYRKLRTSI